MTTVKIPETEDLRRVTCPVTMLFGADDPRP
jgi:hypothetical protein